MLSTWDMTTWMAADLALQKPDYSIIHNVCRASCARPSFVYIRMCTFKALAATGCVIPEVSQGCLVAVLK